MKTRLVLSLIVAAACCLVSAPEAKAQYANGCGYGYGGCGVFDMGRLYGVLANNVPYYAAFPPVYYSAPVPRTYGYSPFAYPPGYTTPELAAESKPLEIINPHIKTSIETASEAAEDQVTQTPAAPAPLLVLNPYVTTRLAGLER